MRTPIRTRLTALFAILVTVVLLGTGIFVHIRFRQDLLTTTDAGLRSRAQALLSGVDDAGMQFGDEGDLIDPDEAFAQVVSAEGGLLESSPSLENRPLLSRTVLAQLDRPTYFDIRVTETDEPLDARLLAARSQDGPIVIVGASLEEQNKAAARLAGGLVVGGAGALAIMIFIGWLVAGASLRPVERMRKEAADFSADKPGGRLRVPQTGDELARLGETLNDMLSRLEETIERERRFVDDASHELRTPLGILRTEIELALRKARTPEELQAALRSAAEESERLNSLADDLLVLARSDRGRLPVRREDTDVFELIRGLANSFEAAAEMKDVDIVLRGSATSAAVDPDRLRQALSNLIENSLRHSPTGSSLEVKVWSDASGLSLEVADQGPGFRAEFLQHAFDAFARSDGARTRRDGGVGLGLAIVLAIAEAHGGSASATNRPTGGASVILNFPN